MSRKESSCIANRNGEGHSHEQTGQYNMSEVYDNLRGFMTFLVAWLIGRSRY